MRPLFGALVFASLAACKAEPVEAGKPAELAATPVQAAPVPAPVVAPVPVVVAVPEPEPPIVVTISVASFRSDQLDECDDFEINLDPVKVPAEKRTPEKLAELRDRFIKPDGKSKEPQTIPIPRKCAEQFASRTMFAACTAKDLKGTRAGAAGVTVNIVGRYYRLATAVESDTFMKQCLQMGGDWQATADQDAVAMERRREKMRKLEKMIADGEKAANEYGY